jgi:predicted transcriptional regulator
MRAISVKLPEDVLEACGKAASVLRLSRAAYIRQAVERMNRAVEARRRAERMAQASKKCRTESMRVNAESAVVETDPGA